MRVFVCVCARSDSYRRKKPIQNLYLWKKTSMMVPYKQITKKILQEKNYLLGYYQVDNIYRYA